MSMGRILSCRGRLEILLRVALAGEGITARGDAASDMARHAGRLMREPTRTGDTRESPLSSRTKDWVEHRGLLVSLVSPEYALWIAP
jgi:hypothetical protein